MTAKGRGGQRLQGAAWVDQPEAERLIQRELQRGVRALVIQRAGWGQREAQQGDVRGAGVQFDVPAGLRVPKPALRHRVPGGGEHRPEDAGADLS